MVNACTICIVSEGLAGMQGENFGDKICRRIKEIERGEGENAVKFGWDLVVDGV